MDYTRIHALLAKYWRCITTVEEERELRHFFSGDAIPPEFRPYQVWFQVSEAEELPPLGCEFDHRIIERIACIRRKKRQRLLFSILSVITLICFAILVLFLGTLFFTSD